MKNKIKKTLILQIIGAVSFIAILQYAKQYNYLLFHSIIEIIGIVISLIIFIVVWNSRHTLDNNFFLILGISFLFLGVFDFIHTLAYKGMNIFIGSSTNLPTQLWIAARFLQSLSILVSVLFLYKKKFNVINVLAIYFSISVILLLLIYFGIFPDCYIEGYGLTLFKKISEYIISTIFFLTILFIIFKRKEFLKEVYYYLIVSLILLIASEICFTLYIDVYGFFNALGHYFKLFSFYFIYKGVFKSCFLNPFSTLYKNLAEREEQYRLIVENQNELIDKLDTNGNLLFVSPSYCAFYEKKPEELIGKNFLTLVLEEQRWEALNAFKKVKEYPFISKSLQVVKTSKGVKWVEWTNKAVLNSENNIDFIIGVGRDVTELKKFEEEKNFLIFRDKLTGLYNSNFFYEELRRLDTSKTLPMGVIIGDVDSLGLINSSFGLQAGDQILVKIAEILKNVCRENIIIARIGDDEFGVILIHTNLDEINDTVTRIYKSCYEKNAYLDGKLQISISIGFALKRNIKEKIEDVLKEAGNSMKRKKFINQKSFASSVITVILNSLKERDIYTEGHLKRTKDLALKVANLLNFTQTQIDNLILLSILHDIGKVAISDDILFKPAPLTEEEFNIIKQHPEIGYRIASSVEGLKPIAELILYHHERWDGSGYPKGLKGAEIPLLSRVIAVIDAYDAMIYPRPYKTPISKENAKKEILKCSGTQFDPEIVKIFLSIV